jgi:hypothetical protein
MYSGFEDIPQTSEKVQGSTLSSEFSGWLQEPSAI